MVKFDQHVTPPSSNKDLEIIAIFNIGNIGEKEMPYYDTNSLQKVKQMNLLTYLQQNEPQELVYVGGNTYCTREHDSLCDQGTVL